MPMYACVRLCILVYGYVYSGIPMYGYTQLFTGMCTSVRLGIYGHTQVYVAVQRYICVWICIPMQGYIYLCIPVYGYVYLCTAMYIWPYTGVRSSTKVYIHTCVRLRLSVYGNV